VWYEGGWRGGGQKCYSQPTDHKVVEVEGRAKGRLSDGGEEEGKGIRVKCVTSWRE